MPQLAQEYQAFVAYYNPEYQMGQAQFERFGSIARTPENCFVRRFWLTYDFQPFPRKDPNLPQELLPKNWISATARNLFTHYRHLLSWGIGDFIDAIVSNQ